MADGSVFTSTPSKTPSTANDKLGRLEKLVKKHQRGDLPALDWLDKSAFRQIERVHAEESARSEEMYLYVDLLRFDFPVVFSEPDYPPPSLPFLSTSAQQPTTTAGGGTGTGTNVVSGGSNRREIFTVVDPEVARENPVEAKHTRLHRSHRTGPLDRELRPEKSVRDELNVGPLSSSPRIPRLISYGETGDPQLPLDQAPVPKRPRPGLALPLLPHARIPRVDQVPQIRRLVRPLGVPPGGRRAAPAVVRRRRRRRVGAARAARRVPRAAESPRVRGEAAGQGRR